MTKKVNYIFLSLGLFSLLLSVFDFSLEHDFFGGLLAVAWGLLFIFLSSKTVFEPKVSPKTISILHAIFVIFVIISGVLKLLFKLKVID